MMLSLDDPKWQQLHGAYRAPYDASRALRALRDGKDVWEQLWSELHHQGDIGEASYAAVPHLVAIARTAVSRDWNFYSLLAIIEVGRHRIDNPPLPLWLRESYEAAWRDAFDLAVTELSSTPDAMTMQAILSVLALAKGHLKVGALLVDLDSSQIDDLLENQHGWSECFIDALA